MTALFEAIKSRSLDEAYTLLQQNVGLDSQADNGATPLHEAVRIKNAHLAACILARGADFTIRDKKNRTPLDLSYTDLQTLHRIRQEFQRLEDPAYSDESSLDPQLTLLLDQLRRAGIVKVSGLLNALELKELQNSFSAWGRKMEISRCSGEASFTHYDQEEYWHDAHQSYVTNDAMKHSPLFARFCCHPSLATTANYYLGRAAHIKRAYFMRYLPRDDMDRNQFRWHHDMEDRQIKAMLLLTDVGEKDQFMSYVLGSHDTFHPYERFLQNALDFDYCSSYLDRLEVVKTIGKAGDVFLFDSNGMHKGNRSMGRLRDALFVEYTADGNQNNIWGTEVTHHELDALADDENSITQFMAIKPKWNRHAQKKRKLPTWADSLEEPSVWINSGNTR